MSTPTTTKPRRAKPITPTSSKFTRLGDINRRMTAEASDFVRELNEMTDNGTSTRRIQSHLKVQLQRMRTLLARLEQADRDA
jgi:hypothetical protein